MRIQVVRQLCGFAFGLLLPAAVVSLSVDQGMAAASEPMNACGCYRDDQGTCKCTRKSKCGCPEECEPMGCEARRQQEADKAATAALKQIAERDRKKAAESAQSAKKPAGVTKAAKRDKAAEKAERSAQAAQQAAMKAALRAADKANPTPTRTDQRSQADPLALPR
jgi:hypothetical protein